MSERKIAESKSNGKTIQVFDASPESMDDETLGKFVAHSLEQLAVFSEKLKPYYLNLRERFAAKKSKSATINGCRTWDEYCTKVLERTRRAVNYFLVGGNPGTHHPPQVQTGAPEPGGKPFPTQTVAVEVIDEKRQPQTIAVQLIEPKPSPPTRIVVQSRLVTRNIVGVGYREPSADDDPPGEEPPLDAKEHAASAMRLTSAVAKSRRHIVESLAREAKKWLCGRLEEFEASGYSVVDPEEINLAPPDIEILMNCKDWMERILRANEVHGSADMDARGGAA
jgi:hypothetical protein